MVAHFDIWEPGDTPYKSGAHGSTQDSFVLPYLMWTDSVNIFLVFLVLPIPPAWYLLRKQSKRALLYPPGPKGYPLIGNLLDFPFRVPLWEGLADLAGKHGGILLSYGPSKPELSPLTGDLLKF